MRRTFILLAFVVATAGPAMAQSAAPQPQCPVARMTLLGALIGFGAGAAVASPLGAPIGGNVFEDTGDTGQKMWFTVGLLTVTGAVVGHVLARRRCGAQHRPSLPAPNPLSEAEAEWLARRVRLGAGGEIFTSTVRFCNLDEDGLLPSWYQKLTIPEALQAVQGEGRRQPVACRRPSHEGETCREVREGDQGDRKR